MKSASAFTEERAVQQLERNSETVNAKFTLRVIPSRVNAIITNDVTDEEATEVGIDIKNLKLGMRSASNQVAWLEPTKDAGKNVVLKTDTGAQANLMPLSLWKRAGTNANLQKKHGILRSYSGGLIAYAGNAALRVVCNNTAKVVDSLTLKKSRAPILGISSSEILELVNCVCAISCDDANAVAFKFPYAFRGLCCVKQAYHKALKYAAKRTFQAAR